MMRMIVMTMMIITMIMMTNGFYMMLNLMINLTKETGFVKRLDKNTQLRSTGKFF